MNYRLSGSVILSFLLLLVLLLASCASTQNGAELVPSATSEDAEDTEDSEDAEGAEDTEDAENGATESQPDDIDSDQLAFRLDDTVVTAGDVQARMEEELGPPIANLLAQGQTPDQIQQLADQQDVPNQLFENMIREKLLVQLAREEGIGVDTDAVDEQVELQLANQGQTPPGFPDDTTDPEPTPNEAEIREQVTERQLAQQVIAAHTTADMHLSRHILLTDTVTVTDTATVTDTVTVTDTATAEELWDSLYQQAEEISATLQAGDATFEELASEYSEDPGSKDSGGTYGWVPRGQFVPEYEDVAFNAELGEPVIVESQFGLHVIVVDNREEDRPFDDPEQLFSTPNYQRYLEQSFIPWYDGMYEEAIEKGQLEINPDFNPSNIPLPFPAGAVPGGSSGGEAPVEDGSGDGNSDEEEQP